MHRSCHRERREPSRGSPSYHWHPPQPAETMTAPPAEDPVPPPAARIRSYVVRPGRMGPGQARALAELGPRFVLPFAAAPLDFALAFGRARAAGARDRLRHGRRHGDDRRRAARASTSSASRSTRPASARCCKRIGELGLDEPADRPARRGRGARAHDRAGVAGRRARLLSRPVAQEAPSQAPADPAAVRAPAREPARAGRRPCTARPTGSPTPSRCSRCCRPSRRSRNTAARLSPSGRRYRPLTKFENRGLGLGHGVWDLVFEKR